MQSFFKNFILPLLAITMFITSNRARAGEINDLIKAGYEIKGITSNPQMVILLQKEDSVMLCFLKSCGEWGISSRLRKAQLKPIC